MNKVADTAGVLVGGILGLVFIGALLGWFVMLLWNGCLIPAVDGVHEINWLQGCGLMILCGLLFKPTSTQKS